MEIKQDMDFRDLENNCWGQATKILEEISDADKEDALMDYLEEIFSGDIPTLTEVNDVLAYDWENVYESIGMVQWDELSDLCDSKLIEKGIKEVKDYMNDLDEDDNEREDCEQAINALEHLESEIDRSVKDEEITEDLSVIVPTLDGYDYMFSDKKIKEMIGEISEWISDHE
jgi:hypothetical protein